MAVLKVERLGVSGASPLRVHRRGFLPQTGVASFGRG